MKKKITTVVALILCAVLLVAGSVAATLAYLTSKTSEVRNTFSVGNVTITLDEAPVDATGTETTGDRVTANTYKLIPGEDYDKDPTVHIKPGSESSYLFVKVTNGIAAIEANADGKDTIAEQMTANGWVAVAGYTDLYVYKTAQETGDATLVSNSGNADVDKIVFTNFYIANDAVVTNYSSAAITIQAFAIQADGGVTYATAVQEAAGANALNATPVAQG